MELSSLVHWLPIVYLVIHVLLVFKSRLRWHRTVWLIIIDLALLGLFGNLINWKDWWCNSVPGGRIFFLWAPIVFIWWAYLWAGYTLTAFHKSDFSLDGPIISLEQKWFGQPSLWWGRNRSRWLTELMQFFYSTYFFYTFSLGLYLHISDRIYEFQTMSFAVLFGYTVSYTFFAITPADGPRWALITHGLLPASEQRQKGYWLTAFVEKIMYGVAHKGGAMPSAHSSTAVVFLVWCWRIGGPEAGIIALIIAVGMWIGAVYGRYHYLIDIILGGLLGIFSLILAEFLFPSEAVCAAGSHSSTLTPKCLQL